MNDFDAKNVLFRLFIIGGSIRKKYVPLSELNKTNL